MSPLPRGEITVTRSPAAASAPASSHTRRSSGTGRFSSRMTTCGRPERVRVLVISNLYPSPAHPAFGTFVEARVRALQGLGADVRVVANRDPAVHRRIVPKYASLAWSAGRAAAGDRLRGRRIDVVEAHIAYPTGLIARPIAWLLGAPLVLFAH